MLKRLIDNLRWKCVDYALKYSAGRSKKNELSLRNCWDEIDSCLVFWPGEGLDVTAAEIVLRRLRDRFPGAKLTVIALPGIGASPPPGMNVKVIQVKKDSLNLFGLPVRHFKDDVIDVRADVTVDLSPEYNPLAAYLCLISKARINIAFADKRGDPTFNYQIAPDPRKVGIDRYRVLAAYIG